MTDDDLLKPGAIQAVFAAMRSNCSLIIVNAQVSNADLSQLLSSRQLPFYADRFYHPTAPGRERLLAEVGFYLTFIGAVVIQRDLWSARDRESYFGTEFVHLGVIFAVPLPTAARVLSEPWIVIRYGNAQWTARYFEIWMFKLPNLIWSLLGYSDWAKRQVCPKEPWRRASALLLYRARGAYGLDEYRKWIAPRPGSPWSKLIAHAIAQLPGCAVNRLVWLYARVRRHRLLSIDLVSSPFYFRRCKSAFYKNPGHLQAK
jgi:abequosyltransferase